jgi:REP element-mobilizing transposase RayT
MISGRQEFQSFLTPRFNVLHAHSKDPGCSEKGFYRPAFWARGYDVSAVGRDEKVIRKCIKEQQQEDRRFNQSSSAHYG